MKGAKNPPPLTESTTAIDAARLYQLANGTDPLDRVDEVLNGVTERMEAFGQWMEGLFVGSPPQPQLVVMPVAAAPRAKPPAARPAPKKPGPKARARKKGAKRPRPPVTAIGDDAPSATWVPLDRLDRSPKRLDVGRRCHAMLHTAVRALETGGALTTDVLDAGLVAIERWLDGQDDDATLHRCALEYSEFSGWFYTGTSDLPEDAALDTRCRAMVAEGIHRLFDYLRHRTEAAPVARCRMALAMVLARYDEMPDAAAARAREIDRFPTGQG